MGEQPFWDGTGGLDDEAWSTAWLADLYVPGIVSWEWKDPPKHRIEKKPVKGDDGTTVTDQGDELTAGVLRTLIIGPESWDVFQANLATWWQKKAGGDRAPVTIMHPGPNLFGVTTVYIESIHPQGPNDGVMTVDFHLIEWAPNPKPVTNAAGRGSAPTKGIGATVFSGVQSLINTTQQERNDAARQAGNRIGEVVSGLGSYFGE